MNGFSLSKVLTQSCGLVRYDGDSHFASMVAEAKLAAEAQGLEDVTFWTRTEDILAKAYTAVERNQHLQPRTGYLWRLYGLFVVAAATGGPQPSEFQGDHLLQIELIQEELDPFDNPWITGLLRNKVAADLWHRMIESDTLDRQDEALRHALHQAEASLPTTPFSLFSGLTLASSAA